jgi:integrase
MLTENAPEIAILNPSEGEDLPKRAGIQKGRLKAEHGAWIGYWNERVWDPELKKSRWHRRSIKVCPLAKLNEKTGRAVKVQKWEAQLVFNETVLERMNVRTTNPPALATVAELWERKIEPQIVMKARKTQEHWRNMMRNHILPAIGKRQLRDVRPDDVQDLISAELAKGASPQTVWHVRTTISSLFKRAKGIGWYSGDLPTEGVQMPRMQHEERQALTREQLTQLIGALRSPARELVAFLSMTGLRKSELQGLRWRRVNLTDKPILCDGQPLMQNCIAIREQYLRVYGKHLKVDRGQWQDLKTREQGRRDIPLSAAAAGLLRDIGRKNFTGGLRIHAGVKKSAPMSPNAPVFASRNGTPINSDNVLRRHVKPVLIALGLPAEIDLHSMRHTQATLADQAGATPAERQKILGHASQRMTQRYTHAELERIRPAMETASEGIGEALRKPAAKVLEIRKGRKAG